MIIIKAVHLAGGAQHWDISSVRWINAETAVTGESDRAEMVRWIRAGGAAAAAAGRRHVPVEIVEAQPPYLRTHDDASWTDGLLALPRY